MIELKPLPAKEAVEFFRSKGYAIGFNWNDVWKDEHAVAFTVAKAMSIDILEDIRGAVDAAIAEGVTFRDFQKNLEPILQAKGWWGRKTLIDPLTGEAVNAQLGSARRLKIIYDTNLRMAQSHGRWQRMERVKARRPWGRYVAVMDDRTREDHRAWHGTVLPLDHPWWSTHYPPNGWRCRCTVQQLSDRQLERYGYAPTDPPPVAMRPWTNNRTGETGLVPEGIDPGFDYNVGKVDRIAEAKERLAEKRALLAAPARPAKPKAPAKPPADDLAERNRKNEEFGRKYVLDKGRLDGSEHLFAYDEATGDEFGVATDGQRNSVNLSPRQLAAALDPTRKIVFHHNHPSSGSLSIPDLETIDFYPGAVKIVAHGHDNSLFAASITARAAGRAKALAEVADHAARGVLQGEINKKTLTVNVAASLHAHVRCLALARAGVMEYNYELQSGTARLMENQREIFMRAVREAEKKVRDAIDGK